MSNHKTESPKCTVCGDTNPDNFYKKNRVKKRVDGSIYTWVGWYSKCKKCTYSRNKELAAGKYDEYYAQYRKVNKEHINSRTREWYRKTKQLWIDILAKHVELKCSVADCGYSKNFAVLDFHHTDRSIKDRDFNFNEHFKKAPTKTNVQAVLNELSKCIVLCSNCHRELHSKYQFKF